MENTKKKKKKSTSARKKYSKNQEDLGSSCIVKQNKKALLKDQSLAATRPR